MGDQYAARHNPFVYFRSIIDTPSCAKNDVDYRQLAGDLTFPSITPQYAMITPNLCNDGHDDPCVDDPGHPGGLPKINAWLAREIPYLLQSRGFRDDGLLIVTFDEAHDDGSACCNEQTGPNTPYPGGLDFGPGGGRVGAVVISPFTKPGTIVTTPYNHYSLLRSTEDLFRLPHLGYAGQAGLKPFGSDVYNQTPKLQVKVKPRRIRRLKRRTLRIRVNRAATVRFGGRCRRKPRQTDVNGRLKIKVRARHRGRCRILVQREGWQSARTRVKVLRARKRH